MLNTEFSTKQIPFFKKYDRRIKSVDIVIMTRQLAILVAAHVPLIQALEIIARGQNNIRLRKILFSVHSSMLTGVTLSHALSRYPKYFSNLLISLISSGEESGSLGLMLTRIAVYLENMQALKSKLARAMYYPLIVSLVAFILVTLMANFIIPQFQMLFKSYGGNLPLLTLVIIRVARWWHTYWLLLLIGLMLIISICTYLQRTSRHIRHLLAMLLLNMPIFGQLQRQAITTRIALSLGTSLTAGIPLLSALATASLVANNSVYYQALRTLQTEVAAGHSLPIAMKKSLLFPEMVNQMIVVGEQTDTTPEIFHRIATYYEEELSNTLNTISTLLEPLIIIFLSLLIGSFVLAMYLPIFRLGTIL